MAWIVTSILFAIWWAYGGAEKVLGPRQPDDLEEQAEYLKDLERKQFFQDNQKRNKKERG